ncbi:MAG: hypothetical protein OEQ53_07980 [Saprospiraceae bacterium]|nr:hypothetical protein [Saprospiraceae bacterium]
MTKDQSDILQQFGLEPSSSQENDQLIFEQLADRIAYLMAYKMESLLSLLYRLDVAETKIKKALAPDNQVAPNVALANLIIERQQERMLTKAKYRSQPIQGWEDFE